MTRIFGTGGLLAFGLGLVFALGGSAGDPPEGLKPLKKLDPGEDVKGENPPLKKLDPGAPPKEGEEPLEKLKPLNKKELDKPKAELPTQPLQPMISQEDPKVVMARVAKNMESSEDRLKIGKTGDDTQKIQKQIVEDLDKLINQQPPEGKQSKQKQSKSSSSQQNQKNQPEQQPKTSKDDKQKQDNKKQTNPDQPPMPKPELPMPNPKPMGQANDEDKSKDQQGGGGKDEKNPKNTISGLVKEPWGHLPKTKRLELDAYANEQFMPQYEQLLRQYYQTIAEQSRKKKGD